MNKNKKKILELDSFCAIILILAVGPGDLRSCFFAQEEHKMNNLLKLSGSVGPDDDDDNKPDDVANMQSSLTELGRTPFMGGFRDGDPPVSEIERVQIDGDLKIDGRAKPGGETERTINNELLRKRDEDKRTQGGLLSDPRVRKPVGMAEVGKSNTVPDLKRTEDALKRIGRAPVNEHRPTDLMRAQAIGEQLLKVQTAAGLERDGIMTSGGPTEREVMRELDRMKQLAPAARTSTTLARNGRSKSVDSQIAEGAVSAGTATPARQIPNPIRQVPPPTHRVVNPAKLGRALGFDPNSVNRMQASMENPGAALEVRKAAKEAIASTAVFYRRSLPATNNKGDAFRHAVWSFRMTRAIGPHLAKRFGDAHEISSTNNPGERLMDLYNNNVGRRLAMDPANRYRNPDDVVLEALRAGQLQVRPFRTP